MNVFSEAAIVEIGLIARWLEEADVRGAVICSARRERLCAGANLPEISAAYDMILATPELHRFRTASIISSTSASRRAPWKHAASRSPPRSPVALGRTSEAAAVRRITAC